MARKEVMSYELDCRYDSRASFYGKAKVREYDDGSKILTSYSTQVACIYVDENGKRQAYVDGFYSPTTSRHIKEFLKQNGFYRCDNKKEIEKNYCSEDFKPREYFGTQLWNG